MRRVVVAFEYLYIDLGICNELDVPIGVYSKKEEDLVFFVLPFHAIIDDFHALDRKFTEVHCGTEYMKSGEYIAGQARFYKNREVDLWNKMFALHNHGVTTSNQKISHL